MKTARKNNPKGRRYTEAEKKKVLNHVEHVNKMRGRGGIASASKKFNVTALTISNWLKANEPLALSIRSSRGKNGNAAGILRRLADVHDEITKRERELISLRKEFDKLKKTL